MSGVKLGGGESDLTIPECGLAIMTCADQDHRHNTVPATSRAYASPRTPQPRYQIEHRVAARRRMSGLFMGSEMRSRNALPQREQQVSNKEALTAWDKRATIRPPRACYQGSEVRSVLWGW